MKTRKATVVTVHGDIEHEVVTCSSCGNEVTKGDAKRFVMGEVRSHKNLKTMNHEMYRFDSRTIRKGWACEYCYDEGPIEFPKWAIRAETKWFLGIIALSLSLAILLTVISIYL